MNKASDYTFWKNAMGYISANGPINAVLNKGFVMRRLNYSKKKLALKMRELETKLNRPHRIIKSLGAVQYIKGN